MSEFYNVFKVEKYEKGGQTESNWIRIGAAFPNNSGGFSVRIADGLSVSGDVVILPRKEEPED